MSDNKQPGEPEKTTNSGTAEESQKAPPESLEEYEQQCLLFPTYATTNGETGETDKWHIRVRGWAFSSPKKSRTRDLFLDLTSWLAGVKKTDESYGRLQERTSLFWASNLSKGEYTIQVVGLTDANKMSIEGDPNDISARDAHAAKAEEPAVQQLIENTDQIHHLEHPKWETKLIKVSPKGGNLDGTIEISRDIVNRWTEKEKKKEQGGLLSWIGIGKAAEPPKEKIRLLKLQAYHSETGLPAYGVVNMIKQEGVSVISDIDDTIKETDIQAGAKVVFSNTFLHKFRDVQGMANLYKRWHEKGVPIHYVSNSPWQLFPTLRDYFGSYEFPPGSAHLKFYDGIIKSAYQQKENPKASKFFYIHELLKDFPKRKFILVGDTGELDPEIYTTIARESPDNVLRIFIRDVTTERVKDLPAMKPNHSYTQTFPTLVAHLKTYYNSEEKPEEETPQDEQQTKLQRVQSLSAAVLDRLHTDVSYLYGSSTPNTQNAAKAPPNAQMPASTSTPKEEESKPTQEKDTDELKTPLEMFHERIARLTEGLDPNLFNLFTDPSDLENDPIIKKAMESL